MSNKPITSADIELSRHGINKYINSVNDSIICDHKCNIRRKKNELKKKWDYAIKVEKEAPNNVEDAERKYYHFVDGEHKYKQLLLNKYKIKAKQIKTNSLNTHNEFINEIKTYYDYYKSQYDTYSKLENYLKIKKNENDKLKLDLDNIKSSIETNDRRSVYEINKINYVKFIFNVILFFYVITCIIFTVLTIKQYFNINDDNFLKKNVFIFFVLNTLFFLNYYDINFSDIYKFIINLFHSIFYSLSIS